MSARKAPHPARVADLLCRAALLVAAIYLALHLLAWAGRALRT